MRAILRLPAKRVITSSTTNRKQFIDWLVQALHADGIELPPYWTYGQMRDGVERWRRKLMESAGR